MKNQNISFKSMQEDDLVLLHRWFHVPHVLYGYAKGERYSLDKIKEKYLPRINDVTIPNFIIYDQTNPIGYIQYYCIAEYLPEGVKNKTHQVFSKFCANELVGIDLFIAEQDYLHSGFSSEVLSLFINTYLKDKFRAILVDPVKENYNAISFFSKNNFELLYSQDEDHF